MYEYVHVCVCERETERERAQRHQLSRLVHLCPSARHKIVCVCVCVYVCVRVCVTNLIPTHLFPSFMPVSLFIVTRPEVFQIRLASFKVEFSLSV